MYVVLRPTMHKSITRKSPNIVSEYQGGLPPSRVCTFKFRSKVNIKAIIPEAQKSNTNKTTYKGASIS
jgi:hypothetical protein